MGRLGEGGGAAHQGEGVDGRVFGRWFAPLAGSPAQVAAERRHPVCALPGRGARVHVRVLGEHDQAAFARFGPMRVFWTSHSDVSGHVVTAEKPQESEACEFGAYIYSVIRAAVGTGRRRERSYDVYETSAMFVYVIGSPRLLDAARSRVEVHMGDGLPPEPLMLPAVRRAFTAG